MRSYYVSSLNETKTFISAIAKSNAVHTVMFSTQCKYDFCWVCLEPWKKHSTATGGYFRCNRYEVVRKVEEQQDLLKTEVLEHYVLLLLIIVFDTGSFGH